MPVTIKRRVVRKSEEATTTSKRSTLGAKRMSSKESNVPTKSRISLWDVESDNDRAPIARGNIQILAEVIEELYELVQDGAEFVEVGVSIWENDSDNDRAPRFTGLIKSPSEREADKAEADKKNSAAKKTTSTKRSRRS